MAEPYISNQIAVYKNSKVLLEFQDKLQVASLPNYGHIHADGEPDAEGRKRRSSGRLKNLENLVRAR